MIGEIDRIFRLQKEAFARNPFPTLRERKAHLAALHDAIRKYSGRFVESLNADFGCRSPHETLVADLFAALSNVRHASKNLAGWMRPRRRPVAVWYYFAHARMVPQPLGVVGVISPWNFPVYLSAGPLVSALAAGNRVMLKPSEHSPKTSELFKKMISNSFAEDHVAVVTGGPDAGAKMASLPFDHLLYTGSTTVGRKIMRAASENLTPVTLELGGKSPAIVGPDFPLDAAADSILYWKCMNAGQVCVTTDYVFVREGDVEGFAKAAERAVGKRYPTLADNPDYTSIIDKTHYDRLQGYLADARDKGAKIVEINPARENFDPARRKIPPTLVLNATEDMLVMREEIFGPLLPVLTYKNLDDAVAYVNSKPRPLGLFYFDHDKARVEMVVRGTVSGGVTVNDTTLHFSQDGIPAGGVGQSGMGRYHAIEGFDAFSHVKPVFYQSRINATGLLKPPYGRIADFVLRLLSLK